MRRFSRLAPLLLLSLALLTLACGKTPAPAAGRRHLSGAARGWNVVLLSVDTLRADHLGAYGYRQWATTPHLDAQLATGVLFEQAMSQRAATWPSLASILTGLYPSAHGVTENGYGFPDDLPTLPKILRAGGYRTAAFLSNMCDANHQGWDDFACNGGRDGKTVENALAWAGGAGDKGDRGDPGAAGKPFLLWVHLFGAHGPYYNGGDRAKQTLDPGYQGELGPKKWRLDRLMTEKLPVSAADRHHLEALYDAAVQGSDHLAGNLLEGLRRAGRLEHTIVVVTSDHGEELYAHNGYLYHSCSVYQTALHVPLGLSAPGLLPAAARVPQTVELIDIAPTLLDLLAVKAPLPQHGKSLVPYLERPGEGGSGKPAFSQYGASTIHTALAGSWKLVDNPDGFDPDCIPNAPPHHYPIGRSELYDLARDPRETRNLAAQEPARVAELTKLVRQRFAGLPNRAHKQEMSDEQKKKLTALGYVAN